MDSIIKLPSPSTITRRKLNHINQEPKTPEQGANKFYGYVSYWLLISAFFIVLALISDLLFWPDLKFSLDRCSWSCANWDHPAIVKFRHDAGWTAVLLFIPLVFLVGRSTRFFQRRHEALAPVR